MAVTKPLLRLDQVSCRRGGRILFDRLSFAIGPGEAAVVTGANGAGKSSLLRLVAGLLQPADGHLERNCGAALADEGLALDPRLTLGRALAFWAAIEGRRPDCAMDTMGLAGLAQMPVRMLSTGQKKRAMLARAIASAAPLWLLDEPSNGLDGEGLERLSAAIARHRAAGGAVLAASHVPLGITGAAGIAL